MKIFCVWILCLEEGERVDCGRDFSIFLGINGLFDFTLERLRLPARDQGVLAF